MLEKKERKKKKNNYVIFFCLFQIVQKLTSDDFAYKTFKIINDTQTSNDPKYYGGDFAAPLIHGTSHTSVLAPNGDAVAVTSTING